MPTPHGSRGGMAFSADELRVLRRALAEALHPTASPAAPPDEQTGWAEDIQDYVRLAESVEEAVREGGRLRAFLLDDLRRYRDALPGSAPGYLGRLRDAMDDAYVPVPDDLAALRSLRALPCSPAERRRRTELLRRAGDLAERDVRTRLGGRPRRPVALPAAQLLGGAGGRRSAALDVLFPASKDAAASGGGSGVRSAEEKEPAPAAPQPGRKEPARKEPARKEPARKEPEPGSPVREEPKRRPPTPAEIWPPNRRRREEPERDEPSQRGERVAPLALATG